MSTILIIGAAALIACPCEAIRYTRYPKPHVYRKRSSILEIKKARRPSTNASFHA